MKNVFLAIATTVLVSLTFPTGVHAQEEMEMPKPTAEHEVLKMEIGTWDADMKMYMQGPDAEAITSKGSEVNSMIGEFWAVSNLKYDMMGMSVHGHGSFGYDPTDKKYIGTWNDSTTPYITTMEGEYEADTKTMTWMMAGKNPDGSPYKMKAHTVYKDDDHKSFTMFMPVPDENDQWIKFLEVEYTRTK